MLVLRKKSVLFAGSLLIVVVVFASAKYFLYHSHPDDSNNDVANVTSNDTTDSVSEGILPLTSVNKTFDHLEQANQEPDLNTLPEESPYPESTEQRPLSSEDTVRTAGGDYMSDMLEQMQIDSDYYYSLIDEYFTVEGYPGRVISQLSYLTTFTDSGAVIEAYILDRMLNALPDEQVKWARLMGDLGVRGAESQQALVDAIPLIENPQALANTIAAFVPVHVSDEHKVAVAAQFEPHVNHDDPTVRAAAISGLAHWGDPLQHTITLENGLRDSSEDVRFASSTAALMSDMRSDAIKNSLVAIVVSSDEHIDVRQQAFLALDNYPLTEQEKQMLQSPIVAGLQ